MKLSLVVLQGKPEREIPIRLSQFLIGRDPQCHLRPASPLISKRHCAILVREGRAYLRDFESTNGTLVNGKPLGGEEELHDGDLLKVGPLSFRVKLETGAALDKPTPPPATPHGKLPSKVQPATKKPSGAKAGAAGFDDDAVVEMLLNFEGGPGPAAGSVSEDAIPSGSTVMDLKQTGTPETPEETGKTPPEQEAEAGPKRALKKFEGKPVGEQTSTANVAKAILDKYMRRPRPGTGPKQ